MDNKKFTVDWFTDTCQQNFESLLNEVINGIDLKFLEIGSFEGRSACWLLDNILIHPTAKLYCVDNDPKPVLYENIKEYGNKVEVFKGTILDFYKQNTEKFHFIYIDGNHLAPEVMVDAVLSFDMLEIGGIILFDDYRHHETENAKQDLKRYMDFIDVEDPILFPHIAINYFTHLYKDICVELDIPINYQYAIGKTHNRFIERYYKR